MGSRTALSVRPIKVAQMTVIIQSERRSARRPLVAVGGITSSRADRVEKAQRLRRFSPPMAGAAVAPFEPQQVPAR